MENNNLCFNVGYTKEEERIIHSMKSDFFIHRNTKKEKAYLYRLVKKHKKGKDNK